MDGTRLGWTGCTCGTTTAARTMMAAHPHRVRAASAGCLVSFPDPRRGKLPGARAARRVARVDSVGPGWAPTLRPLLCLEQLITCSIPLLLPPLSLSPPALCPSSVYQIFSASTSSPQPPSKNSRVRFSHPSTLPSHPPFTTNLQTIRYSLSKVAL
ncbi:hypothetical protein DFH27DRAFT_247470 [Peziza echinospora]|nr:hypothetical protein DFH27DRAFT_247470 [Peziza echinospora]